MGTCHLQDWESRLDDAGGHRGLQLNKPTGQFLPAGYWSFGKTQRNAPTAQLWKFLERTGFSRPMCRLVFPSYSLVSFIVIHRCAPGSVGTLANRLSRQRGLRPPQLAAAQLIDLEPAVHLKFIRLVSLRWNLSHKPKAKRCHCHSGQSVTHLMSHLLVELPIWTSTASQEPDTHLTAQT